MRRLSDAEVEKLVEIIISVETAVLSQSALNLKNSWRGDNDVNIKINPDSVRRAVMQEEARKIAHEAVVDQIDDKARSYDTAIAYVLHSEFGFGEQRISRFLQAVVDAHVYTRERYGVRYQDSAYYQLLRRDGIDMSKIEDELDKYAEKRGAMSYAEDK